MINPQVRAGGSGVEVVDSLHREFSQVMGRKMRYIRFNMKLCKITSRWNISVQSNRDA